MSMVTTQDANLLLKHLLLVGGWKNSDDTIAEAFPHMSEHLSPTDLVQTLENLKVPFVRTRCKERQITDDECPALVCREHSELSGVGNMPIVRFS
ncbi:hypothetical protein [Phaeobacter sp.]|uniref:hypothetical protein n=1 Tax=Phaeobacter sp. TaxID=1902409 RepID=UPI0025EF61DD|nr:hypothetical protein [Phaeobacter sp.]